MKKSYEKGFKGKMAPESIEGRKDDCKRVADIYEARPKLVGPAEEDIASSAGEVF